MVDVLKLGQVHSAVSMAIDSGGCVETWASSLGCINGYRQWYVLKLGQVHSAVSMAIDSGGCVETGASSLGCINGYRQWWMC